MERIREAVERAKGSGIADAPPLERSGPALQPQYLPNGGAVGAPQMWGAKFTLNAAHLESNRIIAHDIQDPRSKSFDMLRTQVLQSMELKSWQFLGVTSPTAGCGKTVVAINLALSIARQRNKPILLVDMDFQKPTVARYLGLKCDQGIMRVLKGQSKLTNSIVQASISEVKISVLPCEVSTLNSSEWMASQQMIAVLQEIKRDFKEWIIIFDMPPVLTGDDVITILPQIDSILFVATVGTTTVSEIKESNKHLESASIVRVVLNKSSEMPATYYSRYAEIR